MGGAETASCTYPQQRHVLYAPYQSRSMIMEPRQRGQVRGRVVFMKAVLSSPPVGGHARTTGRPKVSSSITEPSVACGVSLRVRAEGCPTRVGAPESRVAARFTPSANADSWFPRPCRPRHRPARFGCPLMAGTGRRRDGRTACDFGNRLRSNVRTCQPFVKFFVAFVNRSPAISEKRNNCLIYLRLT